MAKEAPQLNLPDLVARIPGGAQIMEEASAVGGQAGGLLSRIGGMMGGFGGEALALADHLNNEAGIALGKAEAVGAEILAYFEGKLGPEVTAKIRSVLPGQ